MCFLIKTKHITTLISLELQRLPLQLAMDMSVLVSRSTLKVVACFRIMPCLYKIPSCGVCLRACALIAQQLRSVTVYIYLFNLRRPSKYATLGRFAHIALNRISTVDKNQDPSSVPTFRKMYFIHLIIIYAGYDPYSFSKELEKLDEMSKTLETVKQNFNKCSSKY